jgi:CarD family transcriptional regulator
MAPKKTIGKSAAKKPKQPTRKAPARAPLAKSAARKVQLAKAPARVPKPTAAKVAQAKKSPPAKKPVEVAKTAKVAAKPAVAPVRPAAAAPKPLPKAPAANRPGPMHAGKPMFPAPVRPIAGVRTMPAAAAKQPGQKITGAAPAAKVVARPSQQPAAASKKPVSQRHGFKTNEWIVYPAHGVGRIVGIEEQEIAGISLELFVITFEKDKMTLRVPTGKSQSVGMRKLAEEGIVRRAMETLKGKARIKRTMWSRRAQEYEAKINSGDLISIAEVVRDLYRSESQPEQSYSERQLYEAALDRMAREIAAVDKLDERGAVQRITEVLAKSAKGRRLAAEEAEVKAA